jgi:hypothetical protein
MYLMSICKIESRRSVNDRRKLNTSSELSDAERRSSKNRRRISDRRNVIGKRSGMYCILPDKEKEKLDKITKVRYVAASDLLKG